MTQDGTHKRTRDRGLTASLALCAMLFLQIEVAGHAHLEHASPGSHEGVCEVCLKLDKSGSVPLTAATAVIVDQAADSPGFRSTPDAFTRASNAQAARGPPIR